jgi:FKBP-type peptidyl-prolyl cis-trans isomerase
MRLLAPALAALLAAPVLSAGDAIPMPGMADAAAAPETPAQVEAARKQVSYQMGARLKEMVDNAVRDAEFDRAELLRGFADAEAGVLKPLDAEAMQEMERTWFENLQARRAKADGEVNTATLAENGKKAGVTTTASGLQYEVLTKGPEGGKRPGPTSEVKVHYTGTLTNGKVFDSSVERGEPAEFPLNNVIRGWTEGLQLMREGDRFRFTIPSELAYGANAPPSIGPNQVLVFEVELIAVLSEPQP